MRPIQALLDFPTWQLHHPLSLHPLHSVHMHRPFVSFCCSEWGAAHASQRRCIAHALCTDLILP